MDIASFRDKIDELDRKLVDLLNERARAAQEIGRLKRNLDLPIVERAREETIMENICRASAGPFPDKELQKVFRQIIAVMRELQKGEMLAKSPEENK